MIEAYGDEGEEDIGQPRGKHRWPVALDGKGGRDGLEHDVGGGQCQTDAEGAAHAALALAEREEEANGGEDEGGEGVGIALVVLHQIDLDIAGTTQFLPLHILQQFVVGERLLVVFGHHEVLGFHVDDAVDIAFGGDVLAQSLEGADLHIIEFPVVTLVGEGIILDALCGEMADEALVLELVEGETAPALVLAVEVVDVGNHAGIDLQLDVLGNLRTLAALVARLELQTLDAAAGNDLAAEVEAEGGNEGRGKHVGTVDAPHAHARGHHGNDLAVIGQLAGEEDDGDEDKESREEVAVERNEVEIVLHQPHQWRVVGGELV